jgi:hypothetical protein
VDVHADTGFDLLLARPRRLTNHNGALPTDRVAQAARMISIQADCSMNHAVVLMVTRAQETNTTLEQIAIAVVDRETRFDA